MEAVNVRSNKKVRAPLVALMIILILVLIIGAAVVLTILGSSAGGKVLTQDLSEPLGGATSAKIDINRYSGDMTIDSLATGGATDPVAEMLASGTLFYLDSQELARSANASSGQATLTLKTSARQTGFRLPWVGCSDDTMWQIHLNPGVPSDITAHSGGGNLKLNLAGMLITRLAADTGGGNVEVSLPGSAANLSVTAKSGAGDVTVEIGSGLKGSSTINATSGAGNVVIRLPGGIAARIHANSGAGKVIVDSRFSKIDEKTYQTPDYDSAADKVEISLDSGAGNVSVNTK